MFGDTENILEFFRSMPATVCILMVIPLFMLSAPAYGTHDFPVFRMQQFDLNGIKYGSRSAAINLEARSFTSENLIRRCAVVRASEFSIEQLQIALKNGLSALLIIIPKDLDSIKDEDLQHYVQLEQDLLNAEDLSIPVYFAHENEKLNTLYEEIANAVNGDGAASALKAMTTVASANSFHFVTDGGESKALNDFPIISFTGKLSGQGMEDQLPTVAIVTHYDSYGVVPQLSKGVDGTGSGVIAMMEIARVFSKLYKKSTTQPKYNMLFLLSGGGKFNYQGTKKWIEDNVESAEISLLAEADYVLCIDAIGKGQNLNLHVSKPPKEGSQSYSLVQDFQEVSRQLFPDSTFNVIHKKVNLAEEMLAWEHERFSLRRLPAGTLSYLDKPRNINRGSIFDKQLQMESLSRNVKVLVEGLARHIFNLSGKSYGEHFEIFNGEVSPDIDHMEAWLSHLSSEPRSQQLITKDHRLLTAFEETLNSHLKEVKKITTRAEKKDPEFVFYDVYNAKMSVYSVKPALFDLFLAAGVVSYLGLVYLVIENFSLFTDILPKPVQNGRVH